MQAIRKSKPRERLLFTLLAETGFKCEIHQLRHTAATEIVNSGVGTVRRLLNKIC